jgi:pimeloyl-ACP methyl ester carboxylesterase
VESFPGMGVAVFHHWFDHFTGAGSGARTLEVIRRSPAVDERPWPLVFVHGAFTAAWCWDEYFLGHFAEHGFEATAISLRGHGGSDGGEALHMHSIADYVADVESVIRECSRPPVLIGHSMGGFVVQKLLERMRLPGAALMASVPPGGLATPVMRLFMTQPLLFGQISLMHWAGPGAVDIETARRAVFSDGLDRQRVQEFAHRMQGESQRAILDMTVFNLPAPASVAPTPTLVLAAADDALFSVNENRYTASVYDAEFTVIPNIAHAMMLEPHWQAAAAALEDWLERLATSESGRTTADWPSGRR